ncbi:uncharacterized protein LOC110984297 [Acanthaster planci]|uniref:Uncharacterized protein LOC110984297 n=1 Tax=Acanthaster planci TaxID=133434 RepID=A0A8B7Z312_ACAPL|nr:uncharacterized protein LOC110984297 [Acanthaster planci]
MGLANTLTGRERIRQDIGECVANRHTYENRKRRKARALQMRDTNVSMDEGGLRPPNAETAGVMTTNEATMEDPQTERRNVGQENSELGEGFFNVVEDIESDGIAEAEEGEAEVGDQHEEYAMAKNRKAWRGYVPGSPVAKKKFQPANGKRQRKLNKRYTLD